MLNILLERISKIVMEILNGLTGFQTDCDLWEYLLVAQPDKEVSNKIVDEKKTFHSNYDYELATKVPPHITIASFLAKEAMEETLNRWIQNICHLQSSFTVTLNNYSGFPPHTIYLRIQDVQPFGKLANALKILDGFIQSNDCPPLELVSKPCLAIARQLPQHIYDTAIKEYAQKTFHESFTIDRLVLLKRDACMRSHLVNTFILPPAVN